MSAELCIWCGVRLIIRDGEVQGWVATVENPGRNCWHEALSGAR